MSVTHCFLLYCLYNTLHWKILDFETHKSLLYTSSLVEMGKKEDFTLQYKDGTSILIFIIRLNCCNKTFSDSKERLLETAKCN